MIYVLFLCLSKNVGMSCLHIWRGNGVCNLRKEVKVFIVQQMQNFLFQIVGEVLIGFWKQLQDSVEAWLRDWDVTLIHETRKLELCASVRACFQSAVVTSFRDGVLLLIVA